MQADPKSSRRAKVVKRSWTPYNGCDLSQGTPRLPHVAGVYFC